MLQILCALQCEANPLIQRFQLKKKRDAGAFPIYENETIRLVISGIGKVPAAVAAACLGAQQQQMCAWLNIGLAGHASLPIGHTVLAHTITDSGSMKRFYPGVAHIAGFPTESVTTVDQPVSDYPSNSLYEMEASGFFQAAQRFSTVEAIHCLKIVSDNARHPIENPSRIRPGLVRELIQNSLKSVENLIEQLLSLVPAQPDVDCAPFFNHCRWTETEQHQLKRLLIRWKAFGKKPVPFHHLQSAKEILNHLESSLNQIPLCFTPSTLKTL